MGVRSYFKNTVKNNTNVKSWSSWDAVKENAQMVSGLVKAMKPSVTGAEAVTPKSFQDQMKTAGLSEKDLQDRMKGHLRVTLVSLLLGLGGIGWTIYIFQKQMYLSGLMSLSVTLVMFAYAFREHFFYFEMKQRRLNCTVKEWFFNFFPHKK